MQIEEEVSLIDLIAIGLKRRRLIIGITMISAILAGYAFVAKPRIDAVRSGAMELRAEALPVLLPVHLMNEIGIDPVIVAESMAQDPKLLEEVANRQGLTLDGIAYSVARIEIIKGQLYKLGFYVHLKDTAKGTLFLKDVIQTVDTHLKEYIAQRSSVIVKAMEGLYGSAPPMTELSKITERVIISSRIYMNIELPALKLVAEPTVIKSVHGNTKYALIAVFTAFFLSILLAFFLEYLDRVKRDPESLEKLKQAWNYGKRHKKIDTK